MHFSYYFRVGGGAHAERIPVSVQFYHRVIHCAFVYSGADVRTKNACGFSFCTQYVVCVFLLIESILFRHLSLIKQKNRMSVHLCFM